LLNQSSSLGYLLSTRSVRTGSFCRCARAVKVTFCTRRSALHFARFTAADRPLATLARMVARTAFVFGGGGVLGATQVGMVRALLTHGVQPDLVVGTSVGAVNGAMLATDPNEVTVQRLTELWTTLSRSGVFADSVVSQVARLAAQRTHLHSTLPLRSMLEQHLPVACIEDLPVRFECVAA